MNSEINMMGKIRYFLVLLTLTISNQAEIKGNIENLFDSIVKNDSRKTETQRIILREETMREQQAFDSMKVELQRAGRRNDVYINSGKNGNTTDVFRRDTESINGGAMSNERDTVRKLLTALGIEKDWVDLREGERTLAFARVAEKYAVLQKEVSQLRRDQIKFNMPISISNAVDVFLESNDFKVTLSEDEEKLLKKVSDQQRRNRLKLIKISEHILSDLKDDPYIKSLNERINSPENEVLSKTTDESKRRNTFCNALIFSRSKRNRIHEIFPEGKKLKRFKMFSNEGWNESINIFVNVITNDRALTLSGEDDDLILEDESVSTSKTDSVNAGA